MWGPNGAGKTSLLEAIVLLSLGRSQRTSTDSELIRWDAPIGRVVGTAETGGGELTLEVALLRAGAGSQRKRIRVNGVPRRTSGLAGLMRVVIFAPEEMLLVTGSPSLRRSAIDTLASQRSPRYAAALATYGRALQQRNSLLRAIREEQSDRSELHFWDATIVEEGGAIVDERLRLLAALAGPLERAQEEIAPDEGRLTVRYETNSPSGPGESARDALARRLRETADREVWNGATLVGPHRDDLIFELAGRALADFGSRGQQRTAVLAWKLAELDVLSALDGRPPILLLDDVFSELDPTRRGHLVRRIAELPQAFVTTTTLDDLDPALRAHATSWHVSCDAAGGATLVGLAA